MALATRAITLARNHWRAADRATAERPKRDATVSSHIYPNRVPEIQSAASFVGYWVSGPCGLVFASCSIRSRVSASAVAFALGES